MGRAAGRATSSAPVDPIVIGHRGACGYRPEHTLASYELAARLGADYVEPDLVITADGVLVARHEPELSLTTDVATRPEFAGRRCTRTVDGTVVSGWFVDQFTLAELKTLWARERMPTVRRGNTLYDGRFRVATFDEVLALRARLSGELGREIGVCVETKHETYFADLGLPLEPVLADALDRAGLDRPDAPVFVMSFAAGTLRALAPRLAVGLVQLVEPAPGPVDVDTDDGLAAVADYADAIGPGKDQVIGLDETGAAAGPTGLVDRAHAAGLLVFPWTFRNENCFLPADLRSDPDPAPYGDAFTEYAAHLVAGVDGLITDNPDTAVTARAAALDPV
ncbi:MAG TPA: glycerophosphodiester phosphodiesterase family protein [Pseudonocardia sp.]|nr:glycerophosphodiester phosphodiesterase family protein [Pseudonocardia sp.]